MREEKKLKAELFWQRLESLMGAEEPYAWAARHALNKGTFQSARNRRSKPLSKTLKGWSIQLGCNFEWLDQGIGEIYPCGDDEPYADQNRKKLFGFAQERAREEKRIQSPMQPIASSSVGYSEYSKPNSELLYLAISTLFEVLETTKKSLSPDEQTSAVMRLYDLYSDKGTKDIKTHLLEVIRTLGGDQDRSSIQKS